MSSTPDSFADLGLSETLLKTLIEIGYETPSPIQAQCIPVLLEGHDLIGMAQTGTGKTAAFALPLMEQIDVKLMKPQALILTPTRELAIQVAEALQTYAKNLPGFHVLPIYGGQSYTIQLKQLSRGAHVIVGTPGRVMDHLERKTLNLDNLKTMVLDEADEMLRMGFIDDVEWILERTPPKHQTALFSATMPEQIRRVAQKYLVEPREIKIKSATATVAAIRQVYWQVSGMHKLDALTRILEVEEDFDAAIIFVRTKTATVELADKLSARGYAAAALNGDLNQQMRERVIEQLKSGALDIVIATDVAARGIDVPRVSHVVNYDIPYDTEAYVHRIGRTGRAGKLGNAISLVSAREVVYLVDIEKLIKRPIEQVEVAGFEPEPEYEYPPGNKKKRSAPVVAPVAQRPERGERPERSERSARPERERSDRQDRRPPRRNPMIAADGFDFSKPYEDNSPRGDVPDSSLAPAKADPHKPKRVVAALLGGLGRK
jgi:ATP-dependent RNA helicase DeaD